VILTPTAKRPATPAPAKAAPRPARPAKAPNPEKKGRTTKVQANPASPNTVMQPAKKPDKAPTPRAPAKSSRRWLIVLIAVILAAAAAGAAHFHFWR
jgi:hypothetical protein